MARRQKDISIILHNIRSAKNVGSIFRTADAAGVSCIYLTGYTPTPLDRFGRKRPDIAKTALGAENAISWEYSRNPSSVIQKLKQVDTSVVAVEQHKDADDYKKFELSTSTTFVFGNEVSGLSPALIKKCDRVIEIPMHGDKESLNVSVAAGIVLFHARQ
jgi:tRNA G18 (ribose-2'-O)-methylase SpoU|tara:strand:+ start:18955 stop:19434 length:480 start_codon:yes stop_codon:yes gene_type:complete